MQTSSPEIVTWIMSPSQLVDYLNCPRSWWFRRVLRLPEEEVVDKWDYGHRLHEVCERWVAADSRGRDAAGDPVELYPVDWHQHSINNNEQSLIKVTVDKAISGKEQVLRRMPGREVEIGYKREVIPGVQMYGKLDVLHRDGFEDHKTTKSRRWISTQKALAKDDKMLCYAYETILRWWETEGKLDPERTVNMRFNYFSKDPTDVFVKHVDVDVRADEVVQWWEDTVLPAAEDMLRMKKENLPGSEWSKVEGPRKPNACQTYGGCQYAQICTRVKTPEKHAKQIDRINESRTKNQTQTIPTSMSVFGKTKKRKGGTVSKTEASTSNPSKQPRKGATPEEDAALRKPAAAIVDTLATVTAAPWARPGCKACGGTGIRDNEPCGACDKINAATGKTTSADFEIVYTETTMVFAGEKDSGEILLALPPEVEEIPAKTSKKVSIDDATPEEWDAANKKVAEKEAKKEATKAKRAATRAANKAKKEAKEAEDKEANTKIMEGESSLDVTPEFPEPTEEAINEVVETYEEAFQELTDAPASTPVLYINCIPIGEKVTDLADILRKEGKELAEDQGKESYYDIVAYERRSMLAGFAEQVLGEQSGPIIVQTGDADVDAYLAAIRPFFAMVVVGTR